MKILKMIFRILALILMSSLLLLTLLWGGLWIARALVYQDYLAQKEPVAKIPALSDDFIPQGITYDETSGAYLFSGYRGKDALIAVNHSDDDMRLLSLTAASSPLHGHGGGIAQVGNLVYLACDDSVYVFSLTELLSAKDGDTVACTTRIPVDTAASFCFAMDGCLFVGEFYRAVDYEIDLSHAYTTPEGEEHRALVSCYALNPDGSFASPHPLYSIALPSQVQGFAIHDSTIILSRSWGLSSSSLEFYDSMLYTDKTIDISGEEVPLFYVGEKNRYHTISMPAFSEDLCIVDDRVVISFESACSKYIVGKFFFANKAVSYPIPEK